VAIGAGLRRPYVLLLQQCPHYVDRVEDAVEEGAIVNSGVWKDPPADGIDHEAIGQRRNHHDIDPAEAVDHVLFQKRVRPVQPAQQIAADQKARHDEENQHA